MKIIASLGTNIIPTTVIIIITVISLIIISSYVSLRVETDFNFLLLLLVFLLLLLLLPLLPEKVFLQASLRCAPTSQSSKSQPLLVAECFLTFLL